MEKIHVFIDPGFIRNYRNMEPVLGKAVKSEKNPLFRDDNSEAGKNVRYCSYPNVFRDPAAELYRCYYTVLLETEERQDGRDGEGNQLITALAYAQSPDGLAWERPALGITGFRGSSNNNLLRLYAHGSSVISVSYTHLAVRLGGRTVGGRLHEGQNEPALPCGHALSGLL